MPDSRSKSVSLAADHARQVRRRFIELTHELPEGVPKDVLRLWNEADERLLAFVRRLEALDA